MYHKRIKSVEDAKALCNPQIPQHLFRGHAQEDWGLIPSIGRHKSTICNEQQVFSEFKYSHRNLKLTDLENLALAQHNEKPTRMLDWTADVRVALYFACHKHPDSNGCIWMLQARTQQGAGIRQVLLPILQPQKRFPHPALGGKDSRQAARVLDEHRLGEVSPERQGRNSRRRKRGLLAGRALGRIIPGSWAHVVFWGGLKGSIPIALVVGMSPSLEHRHLFLTASFAIVLVSLVFQGITMKPLIQRLGLSRQT